MHALVATATALALLVTGCTAAATVSPAVAPAASSDSTSSHVLSGSIPELSHSALAAFAADGMLHARPATSADLARTTPIRVTASINPRIGLPSEASLMVGSWGDPSDAHHIFRDKLVWVLVWNHERLSPCLGCGLPGSSPQPLPTPGYGRVFEIVDAATGAFLTAGDPL